MPLTRVDAADHLFIKELFYLHLSAAMDDHFVHHCVCHWSVSASMVMVDDGSHSASFGFHITINDMLSDYRYS